MSHESDDLLGALAAGRDPSTGPQSGNRPDPTADVSARPAFPEDAALITRLQLDAWQARGIVDDEQLTAIDTAAVEAQWRAAITEPPSRHHRVLTACAGADVVGFLAFTPADLPDLPETAGTQPVEMIALEVDAARTRQGHGSRLLAACVDTAGETGATSVATWVGNADEARTRFLDAAGFAPAGHRRTLSTPLGDVVENLWFAQI